MRFRSSGREMVRRFGRWTTLVGVLLLTGAGIAVLNGQDSSSPFDVILGRLDRIIAMLTPSAGMVTQSTGYAAVGGGGDVVGCYVANVGSQSIVLHRSRLLDRLGGVVLSAGGPETLDPGVGTFFRSPLTSGLYRCELTFEGFPDAVRATLFVNQFDGSLLSLDAR